MRGESAIGYQGNSYNQRVSLLEAVQLRDRKLQEVSLKAEDWGGVNQVDEHTGSHAWQPNEYSACMYKEANCEIFKEIQWS